MQNSFTENNIYEITHTHTPYTHTHTHTHVHAGKMSGRMSIILKTFRKEREIGLCLEGTSALSVELKFYEKIVIC